MFNKNVEKIALENTNFRTVLETLKNVQLVVMSIPPKGEIGMETHDLDQVLCFVQGTGEAILNEEKSKTAPNHVVLVPAGTEHNFINTGEEDMKLFTFYAPPEHPDGTVHKTKEEADADEHHE